MQKVTAAVDGLFGRPARFSSHFYRFPDAPEDGSARSRISLHAKGGPFVDWCRRGGVSAQLGGVMRGAPEGNPTRPTSAGRPKQRPDPGEPADRSYLYVRSP